jgi:hypothetical protein
VTVSEVFLELLSPRGLTDPGDAEAIVGALDEWAPEWAPGRWGFSEPFVPADRGQMIAVWDDGIMWTGTGKGNPLASFAAAGRRHFSQLKVSSPAGLVEGERAAGLLRALAIRADAAYGYVHRLVQGDLATTELRSASITSRSGPRMNTNGIFLGESGLPNVWWANIFGLAVVEVLGAERIATAPAYEVTQLGDDLWYLQLTESILDNDTDPERFEAARAMVKAHLGGDAFFDKTKGRSGPYRTIHLPELPPRPPRRSFKISGYGPEGYTQTRAVRARWEPWSRQERPGVWDLVDVPADALIELAEVLPAENRNAEVNEIPTLDTFVALAAQVPFTRYGGRVIGPGAGTEGVGIEQVWVPADTDNSLLDKIAPSADTDARDDSGGRTLWWT